MMWLCTDWQIDWTAVAAGVAFGIWFVDFVRRWMERRAAAKLLAQLMLIELGNIRAYLLGMAADLLADKPPQDQARLDKLIDEDPACRRQLLRYPDDLQSDALRRLAERVDVLPVFFATSLSLAFSGLNSVVKMCHVIGSSRHDGLHGPHIPVLREHIADAISSIREAEQDAARLARASWLSRWLRCRRHAGIKQNQPLAP